MFWAAGCLWGRQQSPVNWAAKPLPWSGLALVWRVHMAAALMPHLALISIKQY